ncbi:MAG: ATP-binding cassette domain-containing protein [Candidatus Dormiibacterota bacterium]
MDRKHEVLTLLKASGTASLGEVATGLGITKQGALRHLELLRAQGLVALEPSDRNGPGRPQHRYRLTEAAQAEFPTGHQELASELVEFLEKPELERFFEVRADRLEAGYGRELHDGRLEARVEQLAHLTEAGGHMTETVREADGTLALRHRNCPIQDVAAKTGYPCEHERDMYARLLGAGVVRSTWLGAGDTCCTYRITPIEDKGKRMADFEIKDLRVAVEGREILKGVSLSINKGEVHAVMGPNGSGKSTLASALMGHPSFQVLGGEVLFKGHDLLELSPDARARLGVYLALQYPTVVPGVTMANFLRTAINAKRGADTKGQMSPKRDSGEGAASPERQSNPSGGTRGGSPEDRPKPINPREFRSLLNESMQTLRMDQSFLSRYVNDGFSGGEKKRAEILQMAALRPELAILDETDSGLDIDSIKYVAEAINNLRGPDLGVLIITHYTRILEFIQPDFVHVLVDGKVVRSGGPEIADELEHTGYAEWVAEPAALNEEVR